MCIRDRASSATETHRPDLQDTPQAKQDEDTVSNTKRSYKTKSSIVIDEETLRKIDTEFILKQETKRREFIKEPIFTSQFIRT